MSKNESSALLDKQQLNHWLQAKGLMGEGTLTVTRLAAGRSNEMFVLDYASPDGQAQSGVLRRPAGVAWEKAEKVLRREYQLLNALKGRQLAVPEPIVLNEDKSVIGALFYIMQRVDGFVPAMGAIPESFIAANQDIRDTAFAGLQAIAAIHNVDWKQAGLSEYGKPDDFHQRQVGRWSKQLHSYEGRPLPELNRIGDWLEQHLPSQWTPTIMHGDYHPLNMLMADQQPPRIAAIVDWETSTIGDPFLDLVNYLDLWYVCNGGVDWPTEDEMIAHYLSLVDFEPENLLYYKLLYAFRQSVLLEGIYQRSLRDDTRDNMDEMAQRVDYLIAQAIVLLDGETT